ncbi:MAG: hypothetical protein DHS20C06_02280 [Hyphobacterium sp.]|nr:MAG: hypothetical protein DHS20C06_02280 [Hyphobacterium sp.]
MPMPIRWGKVAGANAIRIQMSVLGQTPSGAEQAKTAVVPAPIVLADRNPLARMRAINE